MIAFPHAKINIGLNIKGKRPDGFHNLETFFYPVKWHDVLDMQKNPGNKGVEFTNSGLAFAKEEKNICIKAYELFAQTFTSVTAVKMHLHKTIPMGAGLGGGSSDAAFTLRLLKELFTVDIPDETLTGIAATLGSDCAFFTQSNPCFAKGRGEILEPVAINLSTYKICCINPGIHVSTAKAFAQLKIFPSYVDLREAINLPVEEWDGRIVNDFESSVFSQFPQVAIIKKKLYQSGAVYASMTGSGSSVYGIFKKESIPEFDFEKEYRIHWV